MTFRFNDILWLWALLFVPFLVLLAVMAGRSRRRALERFADGDLVARLTASVHAGARRWKQGLQIGAVGLLAFALARPQFGSRVETVRNVGQDIVVAVDLSQSMMAEDVAPSRLERARLAIYRLMGRLDGDRIGLVAFAADAFIQSPLTTDYRAAGMFLGAMTPEIMPIQGTDLGAALRVSLDALEKGARESRVLILVTDAEDHENSYEQEFERIRTLGVEVFVVVIGSSEGVPIPVRDERGNRQGFLRDDEGNVVTTRVGEEALQNLARGAGATLIRAGAGGTEFEDFVDRLARAEGEELDSRQVTLFEEQYQIFLGLALLMLIAEGLVSDRRNTARSWAGRFE